MLAQQHARYVLSCARRAAEGKALTPRMSFLSEYVKNNSQNGNNEEMGKKKEGK